MMLIASPVSAGVLYSSGSGIAVGPTDTAPAIGLGWATTSPFTLASPSILDQVTFVNWGGAGPQLPSTLSWEITTSPDSNVLFSGNNVPVTSGAVLGTARSLYPETDSTFALPAVQLAAGTYWLQLDNCQPNAGCGWGATAFNGPAEQFLNGVNDGGRATVSFVIDGSVATATPEPGFFGATALILAGVAGLGMRNRRRRPALG